MCEGFMDVRRIVGGSLVGVDALVGCLLLPKRLRLDGAHMFFLTKIKVNQTVNAESNNG